MISGRWETRITLIVIILSFIHSRNHFLKQLLNNEEISSHLVYTSKFYFTGNWNMYWKNIIFFPTDRPTFYCVCPLNCKSTLCRLTLYLMKARHVVNILNTFPNILWRKKGIFAFFQGKIFAVSFPFWKRANVFRTWIRIYVPEMSFPKTQDRLLYSFL